MNNKSINIKQARASVKYIRMSSTKVRRVLNQIVGLNFRDALILLEFMSYRSCKVILNLLNSAAANAESQEGVINRSNLFIAKAYVNQGPVLKRVHPRAQGRACALRKPTCHITIIVSIE
nr:ribosomal protein L22 [Cavernulicola chilensis]